MQEFSSLERLTVTEAREKLLQMGISVTTTPRFIGWVWKDQYWCALISPGAEKPRVGVPFTVSEERMNEMMKYE